MNVLINLPLLQWACLTVDSGHSGGVASHFCLMMFFYDLLSVSLGWTLIYDKYRQSGEKTNTINTSALVSVFTEKRKADQCRLERCHV